MINAQVKNISDAGATYIAIGTPYDIEFIPFLERWVAAARLYHLKVWFRGNFSGWEGWFEYPKISREEHIQKTKDFIINNKDLFQDSDIFTPCPECENGGPGDPRLTGDVEGFRGFLIAEYSLTSGLFKQINKKVISNLSSMNGDVAKLVMDKGTTKALGGVVTIDHYVSTPEELANDVIDTAFKSGGKVVLGEFGVPIIDVNGNLTEDQQADWIDRAMEKLSKIQALIGLNYWTSYGGSTELFNSNDSPRKAVTVVKSYYTPKTAAGVVLNEINQPIKDASIVIGDRTFKSDLFGRYKFIYLAKDNVFTVKANGYKEAKFIVDENVSQTIVLEKINKDTIFRIIIFIRNLLILS